MVSSLLFCLFCLSFLLSFLAFHSVFPFLRFYGMGCGRVVLTDNNFNIWGSHVTIKRLFI